MFIVFRNRNAEFPVPQMMSAIVKRMSGITTEGIISSTKSIAEVTLDDGTSEWMSYGSVKELIRVTVEERRMERFVVFSFV